MRTRTQLQDWIRGGMQVPTEPGEPEPVLPVGCRVFLLRVNREAGTITATCDSCLMLHTEGGMYVGREGIGVDGASSCLDKIARWMRAHAILDGRDPDRAQRLYGRNAAWSQGVSWANELMRGRDASKWSGMVGPETPGGMPTEGFYLDAEPG